MITCEVNNKVYIGSAVNILNRKSTHFSRLSKNTHANIHLQRVYNKYGKNSLKHEVIHYCKIDELIIWEQYFIDYCRPTLNINLIAELPPMSGRHHNRKSKCKISKATAKVCHQYSLDGVFIKTWRSARFASIALSINSSDVSFCCRKGVKSCGGFLWSYTKEEKLPAYTNKSQRPIVLLSRGKIIKEWRSLTACAKDYLVSIDMIVKHIKKQVVKKSINLKYKDETIRVS